MPKAKTEIAQKSRQKQDVKNLSINGELLERFNRLRRLESNKLGYELTIKQFLTIIILQTENKLLKEKEKNS
jgi:hypothetical protein|tara:strand:+ start:253 stop:468 length:216 start_codon:yes stop_codon:yes gene_type:complete